MVSILGTRAVHAGSAVGECSWPAWQEPRPRLFFMLRGGSTRAWMGIAEHTKKERRGVAVQCTQIADNPFAVLTAIVAPAILTNASSVLALGTSNRLARVVDRTRVVARELAGFEPESPEHQMWDAQLGSLKVRAQMLLKALRLFYGGLGSFAASALVSVGGSIAVYYGQKLLFEVTAVLAVVTGATAVIGRGMQRNRKVK
jgi:hypothetical protein